ncbi:MAG: hypothetical protein LBP91_02330 [Coriobacteriales bacterium]|jgi:pilin isopeptide linkage protein|nr:hypothetical protein [Coriobacteriales bacterium]
MNKPLSKTKRRLLGAFVAFVTVFILALPTGVFWAPVLACAAQNPSMITVHQVFVASSAGAEATFHYRLVPLDPVNLLLGGSDDQENTFAITGNASVDLDLSHANQQGIYRYEVFQVIAAENPGYSYDKRKYLVEVYVDLALKAKIAVFNEEGEKAETVTFANAYQALASDPHVMVNPLVKNTVFGTPANNCSFSFLLTAFEASQPMPAGSVCGVKTLQIIGPGEAAFGVWSYDKPGVYYYTVSEVDEARPGYTYDTAVYTITDVVVEDAGQLKVTRVVTNGLNKPVTSYIFNNRYCPEWETDGLAPGSSTLPQGPHTGVGANRDLYRVLVTVGVVLVCGSALFLIVGTTGRKEE